jgi:hypothetical protein
MFRRNVRGAMSALKGAIIGFGLAGCQVVESDD